MKLRSPSTRPAVLFTSSVCLAATLVQGVAAQQSTPAASRPPAALTARHSPYLPVSVSQHAKNYYGMMKGIDNLSVRRTASGNLIRFSYRVTDPAAAHLLGEKTATAYLYGHTSHALLEIPVMDKVGQLRQTGPLQAGQEYWMVFSNKGGPIKAGERVDVFVGSLHVEGLIVE
ncbi:hypothetical protein [Paraburkholderia haematera]|jgi:hypothetical protein|uniref:Transmembrane protein n=1 Tax=Paraburkholderia haematera TaxID=2793077 RepID=A0ABM8SVY4_9BURK|nr:hypothetical protein [Paraburkholderia haematera]CAE6836506.1 hypothetical protein R69888_06797 [Paraburkholderia haematera]